VAPVAPGIGNVKSSNGQMVDLITFRSKGKKLLRDPMELMAYHLSQANAA